MNLSECPEFVDSDVIRPEPILATFGWPRTNSHYVRIMRGEYRGMAIDI